MKTIPLRSLLREPIKVKRLSRSGQSVQVTDNGKPLWVIQPAAQEAENPERARAIDLLHIACALLLGSEIFLTSDQRQAGLAKPEGLQVGLVPAPG